MNLKASACRFGWFGCALVYAALSSRGAFGQAINGNLIGNVVDLSGAAINNAEVQALEIDTGIATATKTGSTGE